MSCEIEGKVYTLLPEQKGMGKKGEWKKRDLVIETLGDYPKKVVFACWNERVNDISKLALNQYVKVSFRPESREFQGRWYNDMVMFRIETGTAPTSSTTQPPPPGSNTPPPADDYAPLANEEEMPF